MRTHYCDLSIKTLTEIRIHLSASSRVRRDIGSRLGASRELVFFVTSFHVLLRDPFFFRFFSMKPSINLKYIKRGPKCSSIA